METKNCRKCGVVLMDENRAPYLSINQCICHNCVRDYARQWLARRREKLGILPKKKLTLEEHKEKQKVRRLEYRKTHPPDLARVRAYHQGIREEVIAAYGGVCANTECGETRSEILTIDHINGGGTQHRILLSGKTPSGKSRMGGSRFYSWLRKNGFPKDNFRLLCYNCNCCLGRRGSFPSPRRSVTNG